MKKIFIYGSGGHGRVIKELIIAKNEYLFMGFIDDDESKIGELDILGTFSMIKELELDDKCCVIGIGDNYKRYEISQKIQNLYPKIEFPSLIHPTAYISPDVKIGIGNVICMKSCIGTNSIIGNFCILNTNSSLDHDGRMGDYSSLGPGVTCGGMCDIDKGAAICLGANIRHKIYIGEWSIIGMGSNVIKDVESHDLVFGNPAKYQRYHQKGEKYL